MLKAVSPVINFNALTELEHGFQKNLSELIELYLKDADKKLEQLQKANHENNLKNILCGVRELRNRSMDVGAIQFSFNCLNLELAVQERRLESIAGLLKQIITNFTQVSTELLRIRQQLDGH